MSRAAITLDRATFAWCALAVASALTPLAPTLPPWLAGLLFALAALGAGFGLRQRTLSPWVRLPLTLGVAAVVLLAYDFSFGRDTGAALLVTMLALKLLETRGVRDARSVLSFALFAIMAGFLQDQGPTTLLLALVATLLVVTALARVSEVELPPGAVAPATPRDARRRLLHAARLLALSLPLAAVGFFLFPRLANPLWGMPENAADARTGLSDEMAPGDIANLFVDDSPVLRVQFDGTVPGRNQMYWRGPVLTHFDGRTWTRSSFGGNLDPGVLEGLDEPIGYEVTQEPTDRRYLITLDVPAAAPPRSRLGFDRTVHTRRPQTEIARFRAESHSRYRFEPQLRPTFRSWNTELPSGFNPRTREQVALWRAQGDDDQALIRRVLAWFNRDFTYTLVPMLLGRDSVDDFLFNTRQGYCEHFASAFVVMMRAADIPARVVTGYQGGRGNGLGDYWVVRQSDAHAWAEVWLEGAGWVRVDPTSAVAPERIERGSESLAGPESAWDQLSRPIFDAGDWLRRGWNDFVLGFNAARQQSLLQPFGIPSASGTQLGVALGIGVGLALGLTVWLLLRAPRGPRDPVGSAYRRFLARLARAGVPRAAHEGPLDFAARASTALPRSGAQLQMLSQRYARYRYATPAPDADEVSELCDALRRFRVTSGR